MLLLTMPLIVNCFNKGNEIIGTMCIYLFKMISKYFEIEIEIEQRFFLK